jgi:hypothetical protein
VKALQRTEAERKKAERAFIRAKQQLLRSSRAPRRASQQNLVSTTAEMVVGRQVGSLPSQSSDMSIGSTSTADAHMPKHQHNFTFVNHQYLPYVSLPILPSSPHTPFLFSHPYHQFGTPIQSTLSSQPPIVNPHLPGMPQSPHLYPLSHVNAQIRQSWPLPSQAPQGHHGQPEEDEA